jgi:hypothetical protein
MTAKDNDHIQEDHPEISMDEPLIVTPFAQTTEAPCMELQLSFIG